MHAPIEPHARQWWLCYTEAGKERESTAVAVYAYSSVCYRVVKPVQPLHILPLTNYSAPLAQEQMRFEEI
jgi:hypothetical protein